MFSAICGFFAAVVYSSFLEWFIHKHVMHTTRVSREAFRRHVVDHHNTRQAMARFYIPVEDEKSYDLGATSAIPILWLLHAPLFFLVGYAFGVAAGVGAALGGGLYLLGYEVVHHFIHAPKGYKWQGSRAFRFLCEYHRVHHHKPRVNYNIVLPIADFCLRTMTLHDLRVEPNRPLNVPPDEGPKTVWREKTTSDVR